MFASFFSHAPLRRFLRVTSVAAILGMAPAASAQTPDLLAFHCLGPSQASVDTATTVTVLIMNLGASYTGDIELEVLLTDDLSIDASDLVIGTKTVSVVGAYTVSTFIPDTVPTGYYSFALRVTPVAGELEIVNNEVLGSQVILYQTDLCVDSSADMVVGATTGGINPDPQTILVSNCGSGTSLMVFTVIETPGVPWLTVTPSTSFVSSVGSPQPVTLLFNSSGLAPGDYTTELRLQNFSVPTDYETFNVTLSVNNVSVRAGDLVLGTIDSESDADEFVFDAVAGMSFTMKVASQTGNLAPRLTILDEADNVVKSWDIPHTKKSVKKTKKLAASGQFKVRIEGSNGSLGTYEIKTGWSLPAAAKKRKVNLRDKTGDGAASVSVLALPGATLTFVAQPKKKKFTGPMSIAFTLPDSTSSDIGTYSQSTATGGIRAEGIPLEDWGMYGITISGFGKSKDRAKVTVTPTQPLGTSAVFLP